MTSSGKVIRIYELSPGLGPGKSRDVLDAGEKLSNSGQGHSSSISD